mgnify:CR=1 FL=1
MPFQPFHIRRWRRGSILVGTPDSIPDDALRRAVNVRLDRVLGTITSRPGWSLLGAVDSDAVLHGCAAKRRAVSAAVGKQGKTLSGHRAYGARLAGWRLPPVRFTPPLLFVLAAC